MKALALLTTLMLATFAAVASAAEKDARVYILSSLTAQPGKLDELQAVVRDRVLPEIAKHGVTVLGAFTPLENPDGKLFLVSACADAATLEKVGQAAENDSELASAMGAMEKLSDKGKQPPPLFGETTDFSPAVAVGPGKEPRVFELRTYTTTPGNLPLLHARFREHTVALFAKYGMTNLWYWELFPDQKDAGNTLIYLLAHASPDAAKASFDGFRKDPAWTAARKASEEKGGGSLTVPDGVKSVFMKATDYSPIK